MTRVKALVAILASWLLEWAAPPVPPTTAMVAVLEACADCGLNRDTLSPDFDVMHSGKLSQVLYTAALRLDPDHSIRTVQDLVDLLEAGQ